MSIETLANAVHSFIDLRAFAAGAKNARTRYRHYELMHLLEGAVTLVDSAGRSHSPK